MTRMRTAALKTSLIGLTLAAGLLAKPALALTDATATTAFDSVGQLGGLSGVLIAPNWVLTAGHVTGGLTIGSSGFANDSGSSTVAAIYRYSNEAFPANDIALVQLSSSLSASVLPTLNAAPLTDSATLGSATVVAATGAAQRNLGVVVLDSVQAQQTQGGVTSTVNWLTSLYGSSLEAGDSGGALFQGVLDGSEAGSPVLLGLASATLEDPGLGVTPSAFVQVGAYRDWIDRTMASSGQSAQWTAPVPEPSTWALSILGGAAAIGMARRRRA
ncbi:MAG: trypsin-like serine protease [Pseudomonadota bacterium]